MTTNDNPTYPLGSLTPQSPKEQRSDDPPAVQNGILVDDGVVRDIHEHIHDSNRDHRHWSSELDRPDGVSNF